MRFPVAVKIQQARYCALITVDDTSQPQARTVDPLPADDGLEVWVLTNRNSRKVAQLRHNPRATLYYFTPVSPGYVTLLGEAISPALACCSHPSVT